MGQCQSTPATHDTNRTFLPVNEHPQAGSEDPQAGSAHISGQLARLPVAIRISIFSELSRLQDEKCTGGCTHDSAVGALGTAAQCCLAWQQLVYQDEVQLALIQAHFTGCYAHPDSAMVQQVQVLVQLDRIRHFLDQLNTEASLLLAEMDQGGDAYQNNNALKALHQKSVLLVEKLQAVYNARIEFAGDSLFATLESNIERFRDHGEMQTAATTIVLPPLGFGQLQVLPRALDDIILALCAPVAPLDEEAQMHILDVLQHLMDQILNDDTPSLQQLTMAWRANFGTTELRGVLEQIHTLYMNDENEFEDMITQVLQTKTENEKQMWEISTVVFGEENTAALQAVVEAAMAAVPDYIRHGDTGERAQHKISSKDFVRVLHMVRLASCACVLMGGAGQNPSQIARALGENWQDDEGKWHETDCNAAIPVRVLRAAFVVAIRVMQAVPNGKPKYDSVLQLETRWKLLRDAPLDALAAESIQVEFPQQEVLCAYFDAAVEDLHGIIFEKGLHTRDKLPNLIDTLVTACVHMQKAYQWSQQARGPHGRFFDRLRGVFS